VGFGHAANWIKNYWVWLRITERFATGGAFAQENRDARRPRHGESV